MDIKSLIKNEMPYIISMRRYFHQNPEPSTKEYKTAQRICKELTEMGIKNTILSQNGVIGYIYGRSSGKTIALRSDTDALQMQELADVSFKSKTDGVMHSCGHDGHIAMLLGAAKILKKLEKNFSGEIRLLFQPAEELCLGAKEMISQGCLENVDSIIGMHLTMELPVGSFCASLGVRTTAANRFSICLEEKNENISAIINAASMVILALQTIASREINPQDLFALSSCVVETNSKENYKNLNIIGTCRYSNPDLKDMLQDIILRIGTGICNNYNVDISLDMEYLTYPIVNDNKLSSLAISSIGKLFGENAHHDIPTHPVSEDFSYYLQEVDGLYVNLGGNKKDMSLLFPNHSPHFIIDEESLFYGASLFVQYTLDYLRYN